jgi:hypothetical protein
VDVAGGPPQTLCTIDGTILGGTWNREGTILFGRNNGPLYRVSQKGGIPTRLEAPRQGEIGHLRPWFLPDGRHYLYVTRTNHADDQAIWVATLDGLDRRRLVSSQQAGAYVPPTPGAAYGHLLFLREGTLMAQPLDTSWRWWASRRLLPTR